jgi:hypothetical protein
VTRTQTSAAKILQYHHPAAEMEAPSESGIDISKIPKLTAEQAGHLRHFHNLVSQVDGEWHHMGTREPVLGRLPLSASHDGICQQSCSLSSASRFANCLQDFDKTYYS